MRIAERAFTLLELMIVIMILGILAATTVPMYLSSQDAQCAAAARTLVADLELAQSTAMARQASVAVVFSQTLQTYKVVLAAGQTLSNYNSLVCLDHPEKPGQPYQTALKTDLSLPNLTFTVSALFNGQPYVIFDSFGSTPYTGAIQLTAKDAKLTVSVAAITGAVSVN